MMDRDPWKDDIYDNFFDSFSERYIERRKRVDDLKLEWLDVVKMYSSPEVVMYSREEILEQSNWTEEEVMLLFADRRFPMMRFGGKQIVEVHAMIQFFARKEAVRKRQLRSRAWTLYIYSCLEYTRGRHDADCRQVDGQK